MHQPSGGAGEDDTLGIASANFQYGGLPVTGRGVAGGYGRSAGLHPYQADAVPVITGSFRDGGRVRRMVRPRELWLGVELPAGVLLISHIRELLALTEAMRTRPHPKPR